jgi:predicted RNase H-related nuclease YkuK (DUF458 family)
MYNTATSAIEYVSQNIRPLRPSARVRLALLAKLLSDLRAAILTALNGYGPQAAMVASSLYETVFTMIYIGTDDELARSWRDHGKSKPTEPFRSVWKLTEGALRRLHVQDVERITTARYRIYSELCLAKHNNAVFLTQHVLQQRGQDIAFFSGPDCSERSLRTATFVLEHSIALTHLAVAVFLDDYVEPEPRRQFRVPMNNVMDRWKTISGGSRKRWPGGDPFPGKWRRPRGEQPQPRTD